MNNWLRLQCLDLGGVKETIMHSAVERTCYTGAFKRALRQYTLGKWMVLANIVGQNASGGSAAFNMI